MDGWLIGGVIGILILLYLVLLAVGVLLGIGRVLLDLGGARAGHDAEAAQRQRELARRRAQIEASAATAGPGVVRFPLRTRGERRRARRGQGA